MEPITTSEIKLSEKDYFKLLTKKYFKKMKWWLLGPLIPLIIHLWAKGTLNLGDYLFCLVILLIPIYVIIYFYRFANSKENKSATLGHTYQFTEDEVYTFIEDGSRSVIKLSNFIKVYRTEQLALLYLNKVSFLYLPKSAFNDTKNFETVIKLIERRISKN